jgi:hypothetical protein
LISYVLAENNNQSSEPKKTVKEYNENIISIKQGMTQSSIINALGKPDLVKKDNEEKLLSRLESEEVWCYHHPEFATINFVIGFNKMKVNKTAIWKVGEQKCQLRNIDNCKRIHR